MCRIKGGNMNTIIYMRTVPGKPLHRALTKPLQITTMDGEVDEIPVDFEWDGSSSELLPETKSKFKRALLMVIAEPLNFCMRSVFPRHRHPVASCKHDWRCLHAKSPAERKWADEQFEIDVGKTSWWITKKIGYYGVRIGACLGIGCHY